MRTPLIMDINGQRINIDDLPEWFHLVALYRPRNVVIDAEDYYVIEYFQISDNAEHVIVYDKETYDINNVKGNDIIGRFDFVYPSTNTADDYYILYEANDN